MQKESYRLKRTTFLVKKLFPEYSCFEKFVLVVMTKGVKKRHKFCQGVDTTKKSPYIPLTVIITFLLQSVIQSPKDHNPLNFSLIDKSKFTGTLRVAHP